jgi:hypothetical protein
VFSISNVDPALKRAFEPRSPGVRRRLEAMAKLAEAGILVGTSLMPVIPCVGDDEEHLEDKAIARRPGQWTNGQRASARLLRPAARRGSGSCRASAEVWLPRLWDGCVTSQGFSIGVCHNPQDCAEFDRTAVWDDK